MRKSLKLLTIAFLIAYEMTAAMADSIGLELTSCAEPPTGIVAWWPGDNDASDLENKSDGHLANGAIAGAPGYVLGAFRLDGIDDFVEITNETNFDFDRTDAFTIEAWVHNEDLTNGMIFSKNDPAANSRGYNLITCKSCYLSSNDGHVRAILQYNPDVNRVDSVTSVTDGNWHHVAMVNDGSGEASGIKVYIDGVDESVITTSGLNASILNNVNPRIGARARDGENAYKGLIDEVTIYNRGLTVSEIQRIYNAGNAGKCKSDTENNEFPWEIFMPAMLSQKSSSQACQDNDGDGYGDQAISTCQNSGLDCNDNNSSIYPGAPETCGDGIDQDCNGEDLVCALNCTDFPPPPGERHTYQYLDIDPPITFSTITQSVNETVGGYTVYRIWGTADPSGLGIYIGCDNQHGEVDVATDWWDVENPSNNGKSLWEPPIFYCQYGKPVGSTCNWTGAFDGAPESQVMQVVGYEEVTVPYGTFSNSMKARITSHSDGSVYDDYYWIHPAVGVLKFQDITDGITGVLTAYQSSSGVNSLNSIRSNSASLGRSNSFALHQILRSKRKSETTPETNVIP